jgi:hypothetical protein
MIFSRLLSAFVIVAVVTKFPFPAGPPIGFRTEVNRLNSMNPPYTGALVFRLNSSGVLNGLYEADSIRPDPLYGRQVPVTGTISGNHIRLQIGNGVNAFTINGSVNGERITGSAMMRNGVWTFKAVRVHLQNPPAMK